MNITSSPPRFAMRCTTYFGWMLPLLVFFSYMAFREKLPLSFLLLAFFSVLAGAGALYEAIQVLNFRNKKQSKLKTALIFLAAGAGTILLLELKSRGIFIWNELYFTLPLLVATTTLYFACFLTEDRNHVRVYLAADGYHYVRA